MWASYGSASGNVPVLDGYKDTYDSAGDRTSQANLSDAALGQIYGFDNLDRLTSADVGTVSNGALEGSASSVEGWALDSLGNFTNYTDTATDTDQDRTSDAANEIQTINGSTATSGYVQGAATRHFPTRGPSRERTHLLW